MLHWQAVDPVKIQLDFFLKEVHAKDGELITSVPWDAVSSAISISAFFDRVTRAIVEVAMELKLT